MTTSISNTSAVEALAPRETTRAAETPPPAAATAAAAAVKTERTLAGRFIFLTLCLALVLSPLPYGTVHSWSLAVFQGGAALLVLFWCVDAWRGRVLRLSRNVLQWPLLAFLLIGLAQLFLPADGAAGASGDGRAPLSLDPYATRLALIWIAALLVYFAAALAFIDSPGRLRLMTHVIIIFGFLLAIFGLVQYFVSPAMIYGLRADRHSLAFGPFINRHHFAGYMELTLALPLGLLFSGAITSERRLLYAFAAAVMGVALIMTNSRGGLISLFAAVIFLVIVAGARRRRRHAADETGGDGAVAARIRAAALRAGLGFALLLAILTSVLMFGGEEALSRFVGTVNAEDPTTGRAHFWRGTLDIIRDHPLIGAGIGAFGVVYTRYDTRNGMYRLEQAHNDYLQVLADTGIIGAVAGLFFIVALFRMGLARRESKDPFRRGVATGALAGCFAVLVHSFFDFTLHTTANALLFLTVAALATINGRVEQQEETSGRRRRRRRRRSSHTTAETAAGATAAGAQSPDPDGPPAAAAGGAGQE